MQTSIVVLFGLVAACSAISEYCERESCSSGGRRVCGSNCVTYRNECELRKANCRAGPNNQITVRNNRECTCSPPLGICSRNFCTDPTSPVCGTNRKTYSNECELEKASCFEGWKIGKERDGVCIRKRFADPEPEPEPEPEPAPQRSSDLENQFYRFARQCSRLPPAPRPGKKINFACPYNYAPVCASNGQTYANACAMANAFCNEDGTISFRKAGNC